ncbi:ATP-binding protein [Actinomadura macrotermitis]|uniref:HTH luxR-type domain-containing protein n=1 Tax=Actinomadura macrotermitis TaxID=2585200 RepID=A0A7K0BUG3_9ACTN|nr:hypothetical protein [Actinomadura macrotermitis]
MLYGRDEERRRIAALVGEARDGSRSGVLVLRGEAGIGKSALLESAASDAAGVRVLRITGFEAESGIAFAGLNQVLWPLRDRLEALPAPQATALRGALGLAQAGPDRFTAGLALLTLLADLAEEEPVLLLVDDAQWLDPASAEALLFTARRLAAEPVTMLLATREDGLTGTGLPELPLARLDAAAAEELLAARDLAPALRARIVAEAGGNPLALLEFSTTGRSLPGGAMPLPVTERVLDAYQGQIAVLPERTRLMLLIAAAEGRGYLPALLGAGEALGVGLDDLEPAEQARLIEVRGTAIGFRHPLIRSAAYLGAPAGRRITVHQALAEASEDPDCATRHRASAAMAPDEGVAAALDDAAGRALSRGGLANAASLRYQAAQLSPTRAGKAARLVSAAEAMLDTGLTDEADDLAGQAGRLTADPAQQARVARVRAAVEHERGDPAAAARMLLAHDDPGLLRTAASYAWTAGEDALVGRAAERLPDDLGVRGLALVAAGDHAAGVPLLARLIEQVRDTDRPRAVHAGLVIGADEVTLELAAAQVEHDRRHGLIGALPTALQALAEAQVAAGLHAGAEAALAEAAALARDTGLVRRARRLEAVAARIAAIEGDEDRLRALAAAAPASRAVDAAHALLDLGAGRYDDALRRLEATGSHAPAADLVEAAVRLGEPERARKAAARFAAWAQAGGQPWALAVAARNEALLTDAEEPFLRAAALRPTRPFERARTDLLHGEWLRRHRRRSDARGPLRAALDAFEALRAAPWAERARAELRATGEAGAAAEATAPGLLDRLTPQELQVVRLAADGTSSREIAARLFLSPRTVEYHLYKAYPKLGVSSRRELSRLPLEALAS